MAYTTINKSTEHFNTLLYTGDNANRSFTGVGFEPSLTWIKARNNTTWHLLYDAVRTAGTGKELHSNSNQAEGASSSSLYGYLSSFDSDGFSTVNGSEASDALNETGKTYAAWNWKAGTSFTNDASSTGIGSIDSAGSVNQDAGFSICSYTGNGSSGATIKHGLTSVPKMIITKNRQRASNWLVYQASMSVTGDYTLFLDSTSAKDNSQNYWGDTAPTSSVFSVGNRQENNQSGENIIAYCFSERKGYSKFGKYTSINSHDSTFVYLGFKPSMIIFKNTSYSGGSDWHILDRTRYTFNGPSEAVVEPNTSDAENYSAFGEVDFLSNGFKIRNDNGISSGGYAHIYMAFAESPFVTSTGVPTNAR